MATRTAIPTRFDSAIKKLLSLQAFPRYHAALVFGSLARGDADNNSDIDVNVIVDEDNDCANVNHPSINGVKFDITFLSLRQFRKHTEEQIKIHERIPWIAEAYIVFDKTGELEKLKKETRKIKPKKATKKEYQWINFLISNVNAKVTRYITTNPQQALYIMSDELSFILKFYYQLKGRWWVSNKRLLKQLEKDDPELATYIHSFVSTVEVNEKYYYWQKIVAYVTKPMGGLQPISEKNCTCTTCIKDLSHFAQI